MNEYLALVLGVGCAGIGGELFVRGSVGIASAARISPAIVGATVAAFATSSPELSVSVSAALSGEPQIALGDALGSNVVNIALILGLALTLSGIQTPRASLKRDLPLAFLVPLVTALLFIDGVLSRIDGALLLGLFLAWLVATIIEAKQQRQISGEAEAVHSKWLIAVFCIAGLAFLVAAGYLIVLGAREIALSFGITEFVIGATVVAVGTSVPELATTLIAKLRGHDEVGLGAVLGSNIFNGLFIVAVAALIHPIAVPLADVSAALVFGALAVLVVIPRRDGFIPRWRGFMLLAVYLVYLGAVIHLGSA